MKKIFYILATALGLAAFAACEDGEGDVISFGNQNLKVTEANLLFGPNGGTNTVTVEALDPITATSSSSWASVSVSGSTVAVTAPAYTSNESRYAKITIKAGDETTTVTAQQTGVIVKDFNPQNISAASKPCSYSFPFVSNAEMTASADVDWISTSIAKGNGVDTLKIFLLENPTIDPRAGNVTYAAGTYTGTIKVNQAGALIRNDNWTITYEGLTKVDGKSHDDFLVTVGGEDTGNYAFAVVPASTYTASGLDQEDFIATVIAPLLEGEDLTSETEHFYYTKLENNDYIAYAVGLTDTYLTTGYYQYLEFTIDREKTPYEKWLGTWSVPRGDGNTDEWIITEDVEDESVKIQGICGTTPDWMGNDNGAIAEFYPGYDFLVINNGQVVDNWEDPDYGNLDFTLFGTIEYNGSIVRVSGNYQICVLAMDSESSASVNGLSVNIGVELPLHGMRYFGIVSAGGLGFNGITEQTFPATMTKTGAGSASASVRDVKIPMRRIDEHKVLFVPSVNAK